MSYDASTLTALPYAKERDRVRILREVVLQFDHGFLQLRATFSACKYATKHPRRI